MFGSVAPSIFTSLRSSLHTSAQEKVSTLPIIQHDDQESCETKLHSEICKVYALHLDVAQLYAESELFVIDKGYSRKKREKIVNKFLALETEQQGGSNSNVLVRVGEDVDGDVDGDGDGDEHKDRKNQSETNNRDNACANNDENDNEMQLRYTMPTSPEQIPSADQTSSLDDEITSLRKQLRQINENKYTLHQQFQSLGRDEVAANQANDSLSNANVDLEESMSASASASVSVGGTAILEAVQNIDGNKGELKKLTSQAQGLVTRMKDMHAEKTKSGETAEFGDAMKAAAIQASQDDYLARPQKKQTLEEDYQERLKDTKGSGAAGAMKFFQKL